MKSWRYRVVDGQEEGQIFDVATLDEEVPGWAISPAEAREGGEEQVIENMDLAELRILAGSMEIPFDKRWGKKRLLKEINK